MEKIFLKCWIWIYDYLLHHTRAHIFLLSFFLTCIQIYDHLESVNTWTAPNAIYQLFCTAKYSPISFVAFEKICWTQFDLKNQGKNGFDMYKPALIMHDQVTIARK